MCFSFHLYCKDRQIISIMKKHPAIIFKEIVNLLALFSIRLLLRYAQPPSHRLCACFLPLGILPPQPAAARGGRRCPGGRIRIFLKTSKPGMPGLAARLCVR